MFNEESKDTYGGFTTDEETLVQLGFQSHDSDVGNEEEEVVVKNKKYHKWSRSKPFTIKEYFEDIYEEMDENDFKHLFQFPNEPIFCSKEIYESMENLIDTTWEEEQNILNDLAQKKKGKRKKKRLRKRNNVSVEKRFLLIPKSIRVILERSRFEKIGTFLKKFEEEIEIFLNPSQEQTSKNDESSTQQQPQEKGEKLYVRFNTSFEKLLSIGICKFYLLNTKHYEQKKVVVISKEKKFQNFNHIPLPSEKLSSFLERKSQGRKKSTPKDTNNENQQHNSSSRDEIKEVMVKKGDKEIRNRISIHENEFFKIGRKKERF